MTVKISDVRPSIQAMVIGIVYLGGVTAGRDTSKSPYSLALADSLFPCNIRLL
jgi:hypothetical protein